MGFRFVSYLLRSSSISVSSSVSRTLIRCCSSSKLRNLSWKYITNIFNTYGVTVQYIRVQKKKTRKVHSGHQSFLDNTENSSFWETGPDSLDENLCFSQWRMRNLQFSRKSKLIFFQKYKYLYPTFSWYLRNNLGSDNNYENKREEFLTNSKSPSVVEARCLLFINSTDESFGTGALAFVGISFDNRGGTPKSWTQKNCINKIWDVQITLCNDDIVHTWARIVINQ